MLINEYKLNEHYQLLLNTVNMLLGKDKMIDIENIQGLQLATFKKNEDIILNLVNGMGSMSTYYLSKMRNEEIT